MLLSCNDPRKIEAGVDEAGRGCLAGPVFAAAVILPPKFSHPLLNDSKKVKESDRNILRNIIETESIAWSVAMVDNKIIDRINILQASLKAMHNAISTLQTKPEMLLIDGNYFKPFKSIEYTCVIKGDGKFASIAAASILAKTHRDAYMKKIHEEYNYYGWTKNKGYGTSLHCAAIAEYGMSKYHRKSFKLKVKL